MFVPLWGSFDPVTKERVVHGVCCLDVFLYSYADGECVEANEVVWTESKRRCVFKCLLEK